MIPSIIKDMNIDVELSNYMEYLQSKTKAKLHTASKYKLMVNRFLCSGINIYDMENRVYLEYEDFIKFCIFNNLQTVPIIHDNIIA